MRDLDAERRARMEAWCKQELEELMKRRTRKEWLRWRLPMEDWMELRREGIEFARLEIARRRRPGRAVRVLPGGIGPEDVVQAVSAEMLEGNCHLAIGMTYERVLRELQRLIAQKIRRLSGLKEARAVRNETELTPPGEEADLLAEVPDVNGTREAGEGDWEALLRTMHPRIVNKFGGEKAALAGVKEGMSKMAAAGYKVTAASVGEPQQIQKIGGWVVAVVPQHTTMTVPGGKLESDSNLLAISEDGGKKWTFVDMRPITEENLKEDFPELAGKITLPKRKPPVFTATAPADK